jgi:hypothetical protein
MYSVSFDELHIPLHNDHYAFLEYLRANTVKSQERFLLCNAGRHLRRRSDSESLNSWA